MFFPNKIISITEGDRVLEVGPGGSPYFRADVLLEKVFDGKEAHVQRGLAPELKTNKEVIFYETKEFPFNDNEFDYVICSHVLEHIPSEDFAFFTSELQRVAKRGYIEFPTFYYDYIYSFDKHVTMTFYRDETIYFMGKETMGLELFRPVQEFFYTTASQGYVSLTRELKEYYFQGFEWDSEIKVKKADNLDQLLYNKEEISNIPKLLVEGPTKIQKFKYKTKKNIKQYFIPQENKIGFH
ncbi:MAG: class I SAM-dependent methyltransferase [SAR324 cluster bacterium]|nr:class I SAM-dependent methyltransferase [SAR324 cluster bacterium]